MPGYIKAALHKYQHPAPTIPEHAPHQWNPPVYGAKTQYVEDKQDCPALSPKYVNRLQQLGGTLLYYDRAVDPTLIMPVNVWLQNRQEPQLPQRTKLSNYSIIV
jgi:hypothetical protein